MDKPLGYLAAFDTRTQDTTNLDPPEPWPARFLTMEAALDNLQRFKDRKPNDLWSIFDGAIPTFIEKDGIGQLNPDWVASPFELRVVSDTMATAVASRSANHG